MREAVIAYVGLGANLGDPAAAIGDAMARLGTVAETRVIARSSLYRTAPVGAAGPDFINAVAAVKTVLTAPELLAVLQAIEHAAGRQRPWPNAPRTLDLDLLLYGSARIQSPSLTVPHPRMRQRAFVLVPLAEIAPQLVAPAELAALTSQVIARMTPRADHGAIHNGGLT